VESVHELEAECDHEGDAKKHKRAERKRLADIMRVGEDALGGVRSR
jgi:hypothetical protein